MANVTLGMPIFSGEPDEDVELFLDLFRGYLAGLGINPADNAGNPTGHSRALGLLRGCMRGSAAEWFDRELTRKNWELHNLFQNHGQANWANLRARTMLQLNATAGTNSFRAGTNIHAHAENAGNAADTFAIFLPAPGLNQDWRMLDGRPTDRVRQLAGGGAGATVVIELRVGNAIEYFSSNYPTVLRERCKVRFGNLAQDNDSVRDYYNKVTKYGRLLGFQNNIVEDQFFRGLSPDNMLEVDRIGADRPINDIIDALEKIEKRKSEMRLGLSNKNAQQAILQKTVIPIQVPPVSAQEPVITKPVAPYELSHEQLNRLLKEQAENLTSTFKAQIQALQDRITQQSVQPVQTKPSRLPVSFKNLRQYHEDYEGDNPFDDDRKWSFEEIMGESKPNKMMEDFAIFNHARKKARKAEWNQKVNKLAGQMSGLKIDDDFDPMDTSNLADGSVVFTDENGNEYVCYAIRSTKKKQQ